MIRTVLGDIEIDNGNILMHEHIQCVSNDMLMAFGNKWLSAEVIEEYAVNVLKQLKAQLNLSIFVDGTSIDLGRNIGLLKRISKQAGVHIVASTGFYYYPSMLSSKRSAEDLSEWVLYECENGIEGTDIKPGILKCAADGNMTKDMKKRVEAVSLVQSKTNLPMYAHCSHTDELAYEMMSIFSQYNVNPEKTILGHASRRLDTDYLMDILKEGYYICIDQSWDGEEDTAAKTVYELCEKGYEKKLLFSHDRPLYNDFEKPDSLGLDCSAEAHINRFSFLQNKLIPAFEKYGCTKEQCELFLGKNAVNVLDI